MYCHVPTAIAGIAAYAPPLSERRSTHDTLPAAGLHVGATELADVAVARVFEALLELVPGATVDSTLNGTFSDRAPFGSPLHWR
jgi:hypothetical protein